MNNILSVNDPFPMSFSKIDANKFIMGRIHGDGEYAILNAPTRVEIRSAYYICTTPVTNEQYRFYLESISDPVPEYLIEHWEYDWVLINSFGYYLEKSPYAPVVGVSYHDALKYIKWLSDKTNLPFRLPTEAEFEHASKANCSCQYFCKEAAKLNDSLRGYGDKPRDKPPNIQQTTPNNFGLFDMHGLVWQWCSDWFWHYSEADAKKKPKYAPWKGEKWKAGRVIRGGSFNYGVLSSRCYSRHYSLENDRNFNLGFRLAMDVGS